MNEQGDVHERIMVDPSPLRERLARAARRLAVWLDAQWFAAYAIPATHAPPPRAALASGYVWSAAIVLLITAVGLPLRGHVAPTNLVMLYLMVIVITALLWGRDPSIFASLLSVLAFDVIFVPPYYTLAVDDAEYLLTFSGFFIVGLVVSTLTARTRNQAAAAREREEQAVTAFELSNDLVTAMSITEICERGLPHARQVFQAETAIFLPTPTGLVAIRATPGYPTGGYPTGGYPNESHDLAVVEWAFAHRQAAGIGTTTLPTAAVRAVPLMTAHKTVGVMALRLPPVRMSSARMSTGPLLPAKRRLLESFANQIALALERAQLAEAAGELRLVQEREKFQSALLGSISHDLRTPLVSITGALSLLQEQETVLPPQARQSVVATAYEQATRLNQLVGNLLDMSRLEGGAIQIRHELCDLQDLVGAALERNAARLTHHHIELDVPDSLPLVPLDFVLTVQVLANLIDNAAKYSPPHTTISIQARCRAQEIEITVADQGRGIAPEELTRIFAKFYRAAPYTTDNQAENLAGNQALNQVVGTGLGLSICKGLVEAHGGRISAANRPGGGSLFSVALPLAQPHAEEEVVP
jgi:two-component system sensor histidine kinase KdpD